MYASTDAGEIRMRRAGGAVMLKVRVLLGGRWAVRSCSAVEHRAYPDP